MRVFQAPFPPPRRSRKKIEKLARPKEGDEMDTAKKNKKGNGIEAN